MKAYMLFSGYPQDGCLLVYAETRNKARYLGTGSPWHWDYEDINSFRRPKFDQYCDEPRAFETDDDLPDDAPEFYDNSIL